MKKFPWKLCMQTLGLSFFVFFIFSCNKDEDPEPPPPPHDTNFIIQASSPPLQIQCGNSHHWWSDTAYLDVDLDSIKDIVVYFGIHSNYDIMVFYQSLLIPELWLIKKWVDMRNVPKWCWTTMHASWVYQKVEYLGIRVQKEDGYHYGWIKTYKTSTNYITNRIDSIVYCRLPNKTFTVGHFDIDI